MQSTKPLDYEWSNMSPYWATGISENTSALTAPWDKARKPVQTITGIERLWKQYKKTIKWWTTYKQYYSSLENRRYSQRNRAVLLFPEQSIWRWIRRRFLGVLRHGQPVGSPIQALAYSAGSADQGLKIPTILWDTAPASHGWAADAVTRIVVGRNTANLCSGRVGMDQYE